MYRSFVLILLCLLSRTLKAQTPSTQLYGKIDNADLELKSCEFEPGANALVLFDKGEIFYDAVLDLTMNKHERIKIFNEHGKDQANIRIEYITSNHLENVTGLQAETINLVDGKPEITKLDKKQIFTEQIDKSRSALVFSMPNVKAGSIIEFKYVLHTTSISNFPDWHFQHKVPTRYSELTTSIPDILFFKIKATITQPLIKMNRSEEARSIVNGSQALSYSLEKTVRALADVHSLADEPYMSSDNDNLQSISHQLTGINPSGGYTKTYSDTWAKVGGILADDEDFGSQLKRKLVNEEAIITDAKTFKTDDAKIEFVFNKVKNMMKWDGVDRWYTNDGTVKAWEKKAGNSAEVNLILYHLLKKAGVDVYPMVVSTREHGKVVPYFTFLNQFNRAVVYAKTGQRKYVLDATGKYNAYNEIPAALLNSDGLYIDKEHEQYDIIFLKREESVRHVSFIQATITPDGQMEGIAQVNSFSYNRANRLKMYKTDGEKKYIDYLKNNNNSITVSSLTLENMEADTLPLKQDINFKADLTGSENNYIYFTTNLFSTLQNNPFLNETRLTDVEFGFPNSYSITGTYNIPAGYAVDALPKSVSMMMPDSTIIFKRTTGTENNKVYVRYSVNYKKAIYDKESYSLFYDFNKRMYEMLNEQIVLKKS